MKAETKKNAKNIAIALASIAVFVAIVLALPVKAILAIILIMQSITLVAIGGTNLRIINHEQKKQKA